VYIFVTGESRSGEHTGELTKIGDTKYFWESADSPVIHTQVSLDSLWYKAPVIIFGNHKPVRYQIDQEVKTPRCTIFITWESRPSCVFITGESKLLSIFITGESKLPCLFIIGESRLSGLYSSLGVVLDTRESFYKFIKAFRNLYRDNHS
jgi:hypothetical protein